MATLTALSDTEASALRKMREGLDSFRVRNVAKQRYYEARQVVTQLGISIPPELRGLEEVLGWPSIVVDVLEERLDFHGWTLPGGDPNSLGLGEIYRANDLDLGSSLAHLDALIYGTSFVAVGTRDDGVPMLSVESPMNTTAIWDPRRRVVTSALTVVRDSATGSASLYYLHTADEIITVDGRTNQVLDRDYHGIGRPLIARLITRPWGAAQSGRSEITRPIRSLTDNAIRTLLGSEIGREFFSAPQRWIMGASRSDFTDSEGNPVSAWETYLGRVLALRGDEDSGELPKVGQFSASSPEPYWAQLRGLSQLLAAEAGIPAHYLGFTSDNPASADAIRAGEVRLIKRAERRQSQYGPAWREAARLAVAVRDGRRINDLPAEMSSLSLAWGDPATPTVAASADAAVKLISAGVLTPDSSVTYERVGLSPSEVERLTEDKRRQTAADVIASLAVAPPTDG